MSTNQRVGVIEKYSFLSEGDRIMIKGISFKEGIRIGPSHVSLYMALFQLFNLNRFCNPINIPRASVTELAKISGLATYHKCMRDLHEFGYIRYMPSNNPSVRSLVYLVFKEPLFSELK